MENIHKLSCHILLVLLFAIMVSTGCDETGVAPPGEFDTLEEEIEYLGSSNVGVGMVIGIITGGESSVFSFGRRSVDDSRPPDGDSVFEIGSITKTFTSLLLADMATGGVLDLDDEADEYLPSEKVDLPSFSGVEITLEHLATHTSGLPNATLDYPLPEGSVEQDPFAKFTAEDIYDYINNYYVPVRVPGSMYEYSSLGMGLLGHVLGRRDGTSYSVLLSRVILDPLGMDNTTLFLTEQQRGNLAAGHQLLLAIYMTVPNWNANDCLQGAGFVKSSVNDLLKYLELCIDPSGNPLEEAVDLAVTARREIPGGRIGLGWHIADLDDGQEIRYHNGTTGGYTAFMAFNMDDRTGVVVLNNTDDARTTHNTGIAVMYMLGDVASR